MRIAIIGAGRMGSALGRGWSVAGHSVVFGVRARPRGRAPVATDELAGFAGVEPIADAARGADVIVLAVPSRAVTPALRACGDLSGRTVVDVSNPIGKTGPARLSAGARSAAERAAAAAPGAHVVKAFNTITPRSIHRPSFEGQRASVFLCGDDEAAKRTVTELAHALALDPVDAGPLRNARLLETLAVLGDALARATSRSIDIAFKMLRRDKAQPAAEGEGSDWAFISLDRSTF